jgi:hypothetical protein
LKGNGGDGLRYGEDHMKILGVEKLGSAVFQAKRWGVGFLREQKLMQVFAAEQLRLLSIREQF